MRRLGNECRRDSQERIFSHSRSSVVVPEPISCKFKYARVEPAGWDSGTVHSQSHANSCSSDRQAIVGASILHDVCPSRGQMNVARQLSSQP
mmetsp:Transcript_80705/g.127154  ORF Transcript_80705/g.127154 Transcript_80705/m.127154 type:complete len:92 (-) Transcript_80705:100-375(-)